MEMAVITVFFYNLILSSNIIGTLPKNMMWK